MIEYLQKNFDIKRAGDIRWAHAVNSKEKLERMLQNPQIHFIESDIRISSKGHIVTAHPPEIDSDLTFERLIQRMFSTNKGLKLDFKDPETVFPCLDTLRVMKLPQPILLNADILQGNGGPPSKFNPTGFLALCRRIYPQGILSLGWMTKADEQFPYTNQNIEQMLELIQGEGKQVVFQLRACLLPNSERAIKRLLAANSQNYISIWNNEPVTSAQAEWIKKQTDPQKTFYDFIDEQKEPITLW